MNKIKTTLLLVTILSLSSVSIAQHIGLQAGGTISNIVLRNDLFTFNTKLRPGFLAGVTLDIPIKNKMAINTAVTYKHMGATFRDSTDLGAFRLGYVNLDATYCYIFDMGKFQLYAEGGGYFAGLVTAKSVVKPEGEDVIVEDLEVGNDELTDQVRPIDFGLIVGAGMYYDKWKVGIGYQPGLLDLSPQEGVILRNKMAYLRVAYLFNRKPKGEKAEKAPKPEKVKKG